MTGFPVSVIPAQAGIQQWTFRCDSLDTRLRGSDGERVGFSLVEVVVGLVLLASLLVFVLQAYGAHHRQLRLSRDRIVATQIADSLLTTWQGRPEGVPTTGRGLIVEQAGWWWQTQPVARRTLAGLLVDIVRFEILSSSDTSQQPRLLSSIEIIRPVEATLPERSQ